MSRELVLRSVFEVLERDEPLRTSLGHVQGAPSVAAGARILGDDVRLNDSLKRPCLILSFPAGVPGVKLARRELLADVYADNVFSLSRILDHIERICRAHRSNIQPPLAILINKLEAGDDVPLATDNPIFRTVAARIAIRAEYVQEA